MNRIGIDPSAASYEKPSGDDVVEMIGILRARSPDLANKLIGEIARNKVADVEAADRLNEAKDHLQTARVEIKATRDVMDRLEAEVRTKTEALRRLQDERDPAVLDRVRSEAYARGVRESSQSLAAAHTTIALLRNDNAELRASKKKLREALERAKAAR